MSSKSRYKIEVIEAWKTNLTCFEVLMLKIEKIPQDRLSNQFILQKQNQNKN